MASATSAAATSNCGDGVWDADGEACDDGNIEAGDGCDGLCQVECSEVGQLATEHTCLHGSNGPFAERVASAGDVSAVADVSPAHTYYTIVLPGAAGENGSRVQFVPAASLPYAIYMKERYPLQLLGPEGHEVSVLLEHPISSCAVPDSLTWVRVYSPLAAGQTYTVELGPFEEQTMSIAFEALGFESSLYRDADLDGAAARGEPVARSWCAPPQGYTDAQGGDCDDADPLSFPGAKELCDGRNNDCDGRDDALEAALCAESSDGTVCLGSEGEARCGCRDSSDCDDGLECTTSGRCGLSEPVGSPEGGSAQSEPEPHQPEGGAPGEAEPPIEGGAPLGPAVSGGLAPTSGSGCGCSTSGRPAETRWLLLFGLLAAVGRIVSKSPGRNRATGPFAWLLAVWSWSGSAQAALPPDCAGLGSALVDHSCFHAELGPFQARQATAGRLATELTQNVDPVHTQYRVLLAPGESSVTYYPARPGAYAIFTGDELPLTVRDASGEPIALAFRTEDTGCEALPFARVFDLIFQVDPEEPDPREPYTLTFQSESGGEVVLVIEYVDDFLIENGRDEDGDGFGAPLDSVKSVCAPPSGYAPNTSDCDDKDASVHPNAIEGCGDATDQNCNGLLDDVGLPCRAGTGACLVQGMVACDGDGHAYCSAELTSPADELCNGVDDDCDGSIDEGSDLCSTLAQPACVREGFAAKCGCQFDSDCDSEAGAPMACDLERAMCVRRPAPSSGGTDGGMDDLSQAGAMPGLELPTAAAGCGCKVAPMPGDANQRYFLIGSALGIWWVRRSKRRRL